jgi:hypothetical protein
MPAFLARRPARHAVAETVGKTSIGVAIRL